MDGTEFVGFHPKPSKYYLFKTQVDVQAPPGMVLRTQPHPRFYADQTGTVPDWAVTVPIEVESP